MDELESIKVTFFQECEELLADLETGLLAMQRGDGDGDTVNAVFRAVHSVKGGAGAFGFEPLVRFAHVFETLMDAVRSGKVTPTPTLVEHLLRAADVLTDHVHAAQTGDTFDEARSAQMAVVLEGLTDPNAATMAAPEASAAEAAVDEEDDFGFSPMVVSLDEPAGPSAGAWTVRFTPHAGFFRNANEAALLLKELERLGTCETILDASRVPPIDQLDSERSYLSWAIKITTTGDEAAIRDVFDFVEGDCDLTVEAESAAAPASGLDIAALLAMATAPTPPAQAPAAQAPAAQAPAAQAPTAQAPAAPTPPEPIVVQAPAPDPIAALLAAAAPGVEPAPKAAPPPPPIVQAADNHAFAPQATIRVDPERIDRLIDLVGELVINQAMLAQRVSEAGVSPASGVTSGLEDLEQLTREIQEGVMAIRAQPVKSVFQRMPRLVRETAAMVNKQVRLVTEGESTEVDKTVIERISDPITHMIRNAIDHGLESTEARIAAGKPAEGTVRLAALHRGGRIVIEVGDDGGGINRAKVREIAVKRELISPDAVLTDEEVDNLIFLPGFSTADKVSDVSGRGVGMDVVRRSIQALGGRISISSKPGEGSTFTLSLPLTLAVLDGMVIDVAGHTLVVPLTAIVESVRPKAEDVRALGPTGAVLAVRGGYVPLIDIALTLGYRSVSPPASDGVVLLIENEDGGRAALVADAIQGQRQVVIKSLEANYRQVEGIAAATILGDGRVALILDADAVVAMRRRDTKSPDPLSIAAE